MSGLKKQLGRCAELGAAQSVREDAEEFGVVVVGARYSGMGHGESLDRERGRGTSRRGGGWKAHRASQHR